MIFESDFDLSVCEPYLTQTELDMTVIIKAYDSATDVSEKLDSELTRLRLHSEDHKLKIDSLER